jgi:hypothetical protein
MTNLIIMYNPANTHFHEVPDNDTDRINRLTESGYRKTEKYDLVAIYSPSLNDHQTILRSDLQSWLGRGYYAEPTVVYHPEQGKRTVSAEEAKHLYSQGWFDSPAKFSKADTNALVEKAVKELKELDTAPKAKTSKAPKPADPAKAA